MQRYRIYIIPPLIVLGLTGLVLLGMQVLVFAPRERAQVATATAQAQILEYQAQGAATAMAAAATADALGELAHLRAAAQANNATATAAAQQDAGALSATATAQAEANIAVAEASRCKTLSQYTLETAGMPALSPQVGSTWVTDKAWPAVHADWTVTNTGACVWQSVQLKTLAGETLDVKLFRDGEELRRLDPGGRATLRLDFPRQAAPAQGEWILVVNGLTLFDLSHLRLDLEERRWIIAVAPTPAPTSIPTPTPIPPRPVVCTIVCDQCDDCEGNGVDADGNPICIKVDCNCREECH